MRTRQRVCSLPWRLRYAMGYDAKLCSAVLANAERQRRISACFGQPQRPAAELVDAFITGLGMPRTLSEVDVREDQLDHIAEYTMLDLWARTNPRIINAPADIRQILEMAL